MISPAKIKNCYFNFSLLIVRNEAVCMYTIRFQDRIQESETHETREFFSVSHNVVFTLEI